MALAQRAMRPTGGGGGPSGAQMALAQFVNDQSTATKKMMTNFQKMQEAQAMENAQQSQQSAVQLTEAVNQIVRRQKEGELREEAHEERGAEREYGEELTLWQKRLMEDSSSLEAQRLERLNQQTTAVMNFVKDQENERDRHESLINALEIHGQALFDKMDPATGQNFWEAGTAGVERYEQLQKYINGARSFREDNFRAGYTQAAIRLLNETKSNILAGKPYMDLTNLMVDPDLKELIPIEGMPEPNPEDVASLTDEDLMALETNGGYIPGGLIGRDPDDPELQKFRNYNTLGLEAAADLVLDEQRLAIMHSRRDQAKYGIIRLKEFKKTAEWLQPLREHEMESYRALQIKGSEATMQGMNNVMNKLALDPRGFWGGDQTILRAIPGETTAMREGAPPEEVLTDTILEECLKSVLGPNEQEFFMKMYSNLSKSGPDRIVLDTQPEWYLGVELLNGLRVVGQNLNSMATAPGKEGGISVTAQMAKDLMAGGRRGPFGNLVSALTKGTEETDILGRYTASTEKRVENGLKRILGQVGSKITKLKYMMNNQSIIKYVRAKSEWLGQYGDAWAYTILSNNEADLITPRGLSAEAVSKFEAEVATEPMPEEGLETFEQEVELRMTPLRATFELGMLYPNRSDITPSLAAGGWTDHLPNAKTIRGANLPDLTKDFDQIQGEIRAVIRQRHSGAEAAMNEQEQEGQKAPAGQPAQSPQEGPGNFTVPGPEYKPVRQQGAQPAGRGLRG